MLLNKNLTNYQYYFPLFSLSNEVVDIAQSIFCYVYNTNYSIVINNVKFMNFVFGAII